MSIWMLDMLGGNDEHDGVCQHVKCYKIDQNLSIQESFWIHIVSVFYMGSTEYIFE